MIERIAPVRNPLTIIAMFAGIAEVSGTAVLPFIDAQNQATYIWFLICFPSVLVLLFFATLNFNHRVLYAPSDYRDEENFFRRVIEASGEDRVAKLKFDLTEAEQERDVDGASASPGTASELPSGDLAPSRSYRRRQASDYAFAEDLALNELSLRMGRLRRSAKIEGVQYVFDGIISSDRGLVGVEVKYVKDLRNAHRRIREAINTVTGAWFAAPAAVQPTPFSLLISIVYEDDCVSNDSLTDFSRFERENPFPVKVEVMSVHQLMRLIGDWP